MRKVIGYTAPDDYGRGRRPIYADLGPGRASAHRSGESLGGPIDQGAATVTTIRAHRGLVAVVLERPAPPLPAEHMVPAGAGPIERRVMSAAERAERDRPALPDLTRRPAAPVARTVGDVMVLPLAALPCDGCSHAHVCRIREAFMASTPELIIPAIGQGLHLAIVPTISCDFYLAAATPTDRPGAPAPARTPPRPPRDQRPAPRLSGGRRGVRAVLPRDRDAREAMVMAALRETRTAAARLGVGDARVHGIVGEMRRGGRLPADVDALLRGRSGHRTGMHRVLA